MVVSLAEKCHFLRRTCFSATDNLLSAMVQITDKESLVNWLLQQPLSEYSYPDWYHSSPDLAGLTQDERKTLRHEMSKQLQAWWQKLLITSSSPFYEQITLFWHNHFVSSLQKVKAPSAMLQQNDLFRQQGLSNFKTLLADVLKDPAMLVYLDNATSKKEAPNENLARELLELFTLGEGNYTEFDIKEIARALTGATVNRTTGEYIFRNRWHDTGEKTIFNQTGHFSVDDLAELIVNQPACAPFIATKFWLHFIDSEPIESEISRIAKAFVDADFEIKSLLSELFMSDAFWQSQGKQIKSPVQLIVGTCRQFKIEQLTDKQWYFLTNNMGQLLFFPPNVKGWPGDKAWYASAAIFYRESFISKFIHWYRDKEFTLAKEQLLAVEPVAELSAIDSFQQLTLAMADPAYQVQ